MYDRYKPFWAKNKMMSNSRREINSIEPIEVGYLKINVFHNVFGTPIADAFVRVSKLTISGYYRETGTGIFLDTKTTDENGSVPIFVLPVLTNENETYNVSVQNSDFCPAYIFDVPIYLGITTTYDVYMHHYSADESAMNYHFILQPKIPGRETTPGLF